MNKITKIFKLLVLIAFFPPSFGATSSTVNVLSWFGYLRSAEINQLIENECHTTLSVDEYYSNDEFLRRWKAQKDDYDLIIFANLLFNGIKDSITIPNVDLTSLTKKYHPVIKKQYLKTHYPKNIVFFSHSLMGFLWNPKKIVLTEKDDMFSIFHKANAHQIILIDDPVEVRNMIRLANQKQHLQLNIDNLKTLIQSSKITLSNDYNKIYESTNFAFSYVWSGEAIINTKKAKQPYQFLIHPKTSFICTDLLAQTKKNSDATCVSKVLASDKAMKILQNINYYFSPYESQAKVNQPMFNEIYKKMIEQLSSFSWIPSVSLEEFKKLERDWKNLKLEISNQN